MKKIALIGSTGSIGRQVIEVCRRHPDEFKIVALVAGRESQTFSRQVCELNPVYYGVNDSSLAKIDEADIVFNAAGGFAGLKYSLAAIEAGKPLALANKETLVCGADIVLPLAKERGVNIIPVDSEHSAIWQCLNFNAKAPLKRLIITASGGAFRGYSKERLKSVTPAEALNHPTWKMGAKITVDSATLLNKGYEVIEAHALYGTPYADIQTVIQPQSIVHSLVEFADGAVLAQLSYPTMEIPIQLALSYPQRLPTAIAPMDFTRAFSLGFEPLVRENYSLFDLALKCGEAGGTLPCALNAADEVAVHAFLDGEIPFTAIFGVTNEVVSKTPKYTATSFGQLEEVDALARERAQKAVRKFKT